MLLMYRTPTFKVSIFALNSKQASYTAYALSIKVLI